MTRYTGGSMLRRILVFAVAALFVAVPIAADLCEATCAAREAGHSGHSAHSSNTHPHHSGAEATTTPNQATNAGPHLCVDTDAILVAPTEIRQGMQPPAIVSTPVGPVVRRSVHPLKLDASPPSFHALTSPLRI